MLIFKYQLYLSFKICLNIRIIIIIMANYQGYGPMKGLRVDSDSEDQKVWKKKTGGPATGNTGQSIGAMDQMLKGMFNPKPIPKKDPPPEKKPEEKKPEKKEIKVQEK